MSIEIGYVLTTSPDSANGVGLSHSYYHAGDKEIKYLTFTYVPYNAVGDIVASSIGGESEVNCRITGPISPNTESRARWETIWYNPTIVEAKITKVHIVYMDNTEETIDGEEIMDMEDEESVYWKKEEKESEEKERQRKEREEKERQRKEEQDRKMRKDSLFWAYIFIFVFSNIKALKDNKYPDDEKEVAKLHANQGLVLFIIEVIGLILREIIPIVGYIVIAIAIVFAVLGILGLKKGEHKELPLIGKIKFIK